MKGRLPANTVWVSDTLGVAIVPGDQEPWTETWYPPAAWTQYDKPCECLCHGPGFPHPGHHVFGPCGCRDGRQVWELRTECEACGGDRNSAATCGVLDCFGGSVPLGRATIQVVPVVDGDNAADHEGGWITVYDDGEVELWMPVKGIPEVSHTTVELPLDPLPTPGQDFGVIFRKVES